MKRRCEKEEEEAFFFFVLFSIFCASRFGEKVLNFSLHKIRITRNTRNNDTRERCSK